MWLLFLLAGCASAERRPVVSVTNGLDMPRSSETVAVAWAELGPLLEGISAAGAEVVVEGTDERLLTQAFDRDGDGVVDELLFQTDLSP
ncbi:MAG: DUF4861 family protein, partial [Planctomycetota bacterium]